jgi:citrate lyase subunit beta / citryl-CoA lyase
MATISPRSYLYVPGNRSDRLQKAAGSGADAVIVDLEDSVPKAAKAAARGATAEWLAGAGHDPRCQLWVRVNVDSLEEDLRTVLEVGVDGIVLPKAEIALVREADRVMSDVERRHGLSEQFPVICLVETAKGLMAAAELARLPRVFRLGIGEVDLLTELRVRPTESRAELASLRLQIVVASAAAGIAPPVGPTSTDVRDLTSLRASTEAMLGLGFRARTAIHPAQVPTINEVFTPAADEVDRAHRIVAALEDAERAGSGVCVDEDGRLIDAAVVRSAREVIELARRAT